MSVKLLLLPVVAFAIAQSAAAGEVSDAFIGKTLGVTGVKHEVKTRNGFGKTAQDMVFRDASGEGLITVRLASADLYALWKQAAGADASAVRGVGVEAFQVHEGLVYLCARSATSATCVTPDVLRNPKPSNEQILAIARAAL